MLIALVIAHKDVLAMHTTIILPPAFRLLDGLTLGMIVALKWNLMRF
jgi:hypothetical protein